MSSTVCLSCMMVKVSMKELPMFGLSDGWAVLQLADIKNATKDLRWTFENVLAIMRSTTEP